MIEAMLICSVILNMTLIYCIYKDRKKFALQDKTSFEFNLFLVTTFSLARKVKSKLKDFKQELDFSKLQGRIKPLDYDLMVQKLQSLHDVGVDLEDLSLKYIDKYTIKEEESSNAQDKNNTVN